MKKKAIYIYLLIFCLISFISIKDLLYDGYYLFFTSAHVVDAYVIKKEKRETSEGTFFDYQVEYKDLKGNVIKNEASLGIDVDKEYQVGDVIEILISKKAT